MAIETVLVAVGRGDEEAARMEHLAGAIEDLTESIEPDPEITLLHVFGEAELQELGEQLDFDAPADATPTAVARRHSATRELGDLLEAAGIDYTVRGEVDDDTAAGVVGVADEMGADRILVGGRKRTPTGKVVFGSISQQVLLMANCPVTYTRTD
jgi:nucleotide-binding universal stress UspA family protein